MAGSYVLYQFQWLARVHLSVNFWHIYLKIKWRDKTRDEGYNIVQEKTLTKDNFNVLLRLNLLECNET